MVQLAGHLQGEGPETRKRFHGRAQIRWKVFVYIILIRIYFVMLKSLRNYGLVGPWWNPRTWLVVAILSNFSFLILSFSSSRFLWVIGKSLPQCAHDSSFKVCFASFIYLNHRGNSEFVSTRLIKQARLIKF